MKRSSSAGDCCCRWFLPTGLRLHCGTATRHWAGAREQAALSCGQHWQPFSGGSGKTPLAIALAQALTRRGVHVDVLSRGYGERAKRR